MSNKNQYIREQIQEINNKIEDSKRYLEFTASEKWQYELALIEIDILKQKRERYRGLLD